MNLKCCGLTFLSKSNSDSDLKDEFKLDDKSNSKWENDFSALDDLNPSKLDSNKNSKNDKNLFLDNTNESRSLSSFADLDTRENKRSGNASNEIEKNKLNSKFKKDSGGVLDIFRPKCETPVSCSYHSFDDLDAKEKGKCDNKNCDMRKKNRLKDNLDQLSIKSFSEIELRDNILCKNKPEPCSMYPEDISINSFAEIGNQERERNGPRNYKDEKMRKVNKSNSENSLCDSFKNLEQKENGSNSEMTLNSFGEFEMRQNRLNNDFRQIENFKDKICVRPLNDIRTALNQKREEKFKVNFYKNKDEKVSIFSFSEINDKMRQSVVKNQTDQISFYSFGEIDERERKKQQQPIGGTDEISFNSFAEIDERERKGEQLLIDDDKITIKSFSQIDEPHAGTRNKINQMSINSFDDIEDMEGRRLPQSVCENSMDQFSINSFNDIDEFKKLKTDNFTDDDNDVITVKSFSEFNERDKRWHEFKNKNLTEEISAVSFTEIDERERKSRPDDLIGNEKYEQTSLNSFGEIDETYKNSFKGSERKKIDPYFKVDEPSILSFKDLDMSEKGYEHAYKEKWQNDRISIKSFSELELNHKSLLLERSDRRSSIELGAKIIKNVEEKSLISSKFGPKDLRLFLSQDINAIRSKKKPFEDKFFLKTLSSIVENRDSQLCLSLKSRLNANKPSDLMRVIKWNRIDVSL
jgi:hypothetical protein